MNIYLIHGFIGAGKTTFSKALAAKTGAIRFTHDDWMVRLYGANPPAEAFADYSDRVSALIWSLTEQLAPLAPGIILDFGFWKATARAQATQRVLDMGATPVWISVWAPLSVMKNRTLNRTTQMPDGALDITEETFQTLWPRFEAMRDSEPHIDVDTANPALWDNILNQIARF